MYYRLYLLNAAQRLAARDQFEAESDETAITIAGLQTLAERAPRGPGRKETAFERQVSPDSSRVPVFREQSWQCSFPGLTRMPSAPENEPAG